ncbi:MAG: hypothetical protein EA343_00700 [Nodularia sp. (in: Bacteria)]|nr:MAG: hypothetical protein EA343_00700 [Nodularia sp. (in: cyanobacteria)]
MVEPNKIGAISPVTVHIQHNSSAGGDDAIVIAELVLSIQRCCKQIPGMRKGTFNGDKKIILSALVQLCIMRIWDKWLSDLQSHPCCNKIYYEVLYFIF